MKIEVATYEGWELIVQRRPQMVYRYGKTSLNQAAWDLNMFVTARET